MFFYQRVRACKELGIVDVPCRVTHYPENDPQTGNSREDMILEDLISTNILQRGVGNVNPMKMARCIVELERIYGIRQGSAFKKAESDNLTQLKTQSNFASELGISKQQLQDYKKLNQLIPDLQDLVEDGKLKATTAYKIWAKLPQDEQEKFFNEIGGNEIAKMTQKQTDEYVKLQEEVNRLKNQPLKVVETIKEVKRMNNKPYFFCYNKQLSDFLKSRKIKFITVAIDPNTRKWFSLYEVTPLLQKALDEYKESTSSISRLNIENNITSSI
nr:hypothetical protein [Heyndrickxia oleronia]